MHVDRLARFGSLDFPVLSVYVNREPFQTSVRSRLTDLLKPMRDLSDLDHDAQMSLRDDLGRLVGLADRIDADRSPAAAMFACHGEGFFEYLPLSSPVWDVALVGDRPYLRPLRSVRPVEPIALAVVDRKHAWLYRWDETGMQFLEQVEESEEHKGNYGGFAGYDEHNARNHADALEHRHFRLVAERIFERHRTASFGGIVIGGHEETISHFGSYLHPYLQDRMIGLFVVDPHTMSESDLAKRVERLLLDAADEREEALATQVTERAGEGGKAIVGLMPVLAAANAGAIDRLVVAGTFTKDGSSCSTCGRLDRNGGQCSACGSPVQWTSDVVDAAMERVIQTGGRTDQISVSSLLDQYGVGALLRFSIPE